MKKIIKQSKKPLHSTFLMISFLIFSGLIFFSFLQAWTLETQLSQAGSFTLFFAEFYDLLRHPMHGLFDGYLDLSNGGGVFFYFLFLLLNAALYAVLTERMYNLALIKKRKR